MPIAKIQMPDGRIGRFEVPEGTTPEQAQSLISQQLEGQAISGLRDYTAGEMASKALKRGTKQLGVAFGDIVPAMISKGLGFEEEAKRQMEEAAATQAEIQTQYAPEYQSYKDVTGPLSALGYITESAIEQVPNLATALVPGGIGAQVGRRAGLAAGERALASQLAPIAGEELAAAEAVRAGQNLLGPEAIAKLGIQYGERGAAAGINTGIFLGSYAQNAPEVFQNIYDTTGQMEPGAALLAGAAAASLDSVLPGYLVKKFTGPSKALFVEKLLEKSGMEPSLARKAIATLPEAAGLEGLTEGAQEAISISAEKFISKNPQKFTSEDWNRVLESGVKGAAAGLFFGVPGAVGSRMQERAQMAMPTPEAAPAPVTPPTPTELSDVTGLQGGPYGGTDTTGLGGNIAVSGQPTDVGLSGAVEERVEPGYSVSAGLTGRPDGGTQEQPSALVTEPTITPAPEITPEDVAAPTVATQEAIAPEPAPVPEPATLTSITPEPAPVPEPATLKQPSLNITTEANDLLSSVDAGGVPAMMTNNLKRIAAENNVEVLSTDTPNDVIEKLRIKQETPAPTPVEPAPVKEAAAPAQAPIQQVTNLNQEAQDILNAVREGTVNEDMLTALPRVMKENGIPPTRDKATGQFDDKIMLKALQDKEQAYQAAQVQEARGEAPITQETRDTITEHLKSEFGNNIITAQKRGNLQIANSVEELPEEVRTKMAPNAVGAYHKGVSYLVANRMDKPTARRTLLHEVGEHHGLEGMLGKDVYKQVLRSLKSNKEINKDIAKAWDEVTNLYPELNPNDEQFSREVLAKIGELAPNNNLWRRVVGAVKNFLTKMGLYNPNKFTTADIQDLITHSLRKTLKQPMPTPSRETQFAKMGPTNTVDPKVAAQLLQSFGDAVKNTPAYNSEIGIQARAALSKVGPTTRRIAMSFLSLPNKIDLYGNRLPQLKTLLKALELRASKADELRSKVDINTHKYMDIVKKYPDHVVKKWNKLIYELSINNIYPAKKFTNGMDNPDYDANNELIRNYENMPKELQQLGIDIHDEYSKMADRMWNAIESRLQAGTKVADKLKKRFEDSRLKFYHPLRRKGQYWASYTDKDGELGVIARASPAERDIAIKQLQAQGATNFHAFTRLDKADYKQAPPVGFIADVIKELDKQLDAAGTSQEVAEGIKSQIYQTYLDLLPAESLRQQFRAREGIPGYIEDVVGGYADTASKMANQITNLEYRPDIDQAISDMGTALENYRKEGAEDIEALTDVVQDIENQKEFLINPVVQGMAAQASWVSYFWNIAGNVSSALVNLTQLMMVVYPMLAGRFGWNKATTMMLDAFSTYMKGGLDTNRKFMPDWTFGANLKEGDKYYNLYRAAIENSTMRRGVGYELTELRNRTTDEFTGRKAKVETALSWIFQNSERANREVTMIAAYDLAKQEGMSDEKAIEYALDITTRAHSHTLSEAGPRMFQTGFGKVAFTFKRFAQAQIANMIHLSAVAMKGLPSTERDIARKQLLGIMAMTYTFSGLQGLPLYGAANMFASAMAALFGDDDEPYDFDEEVRSAVGMLGYKGPINLITNIDIASRTGFNGMIWRDDPRRLAEVGFAPYFAEHFFGPAYQALLVNPTRAYDLLNQGHTERALEAVTPTFIRSPLKAFRFATEGALTTNGAKIVDDVSAYSAFMQIFGFSNAELTEAYTRASAMKEGEKYIQNRRTALLNLAFLSRSAGDFDMLAEVEEKIDGFNESHPSYKISRDTLKRSYRGHMQRIEDSVYGVNLNKKLKDELMAREEGEED